MSRSEFVSVLKRAFRSLPMVRRAHERQRMQRRYAAEIALIEGRHQNNSTNPSIIHFSFNRAGTQYVKEILGKCAAANGMTPVHLSDFAYNSDFPFLDRLPDERASEFAHVFRPHGYCYSALGGMVGGIPKLEQYKVVLVVRDPRDLLVSEFYSNAYSHQPPQNSPKKLSKFQAKRDFALRVGVDQYALSECDRIRRGYLRYHEQLLGSYPHVHLTSYERMVERFEDWLDELLERCALHVTPEMRELLLAEHQASQPTHEDPSKHLRKGRPGDYLEKLAPQTIVKLNQVFAEILPRYGYGVEVGLARDRVEAGPSTLAESTSRKSNPDTSSSSTEAQA